MRYGWGLGDVWLVRSSKTISGPKEICDIEFEQELKRIGGDHKGSQDGSLRYFVMAAPSVVCWIGEDLWVFVIGLKNCIT